MKRPSRLVYIALAVVLAMSAFAQTTPRGQSFASDFQMIPVMGNVPGANNSVFQTYVALLNPTSSSFVITATLHDAAGTKRDAMITLAAGEMKTYQNFLEEVFDYQGGGAVTFRSADSAGGQRNNRFVLSTEVRTSGTNYSTPVPVVDFAASSSRSYAAGISTDSVERTNIGCFNQSDIANLVKATIFDGSGTQQIGTVNLNLPANAWGQTAVTAVVSGGYVQFDPTEAASCYAVVVNNATNDGRLIPAVEFEP
jgi:hypothetical protein